MVDVRSLLPSDAVLERFAPLVGSDEAKFQAERERKMAWVRRLQKKPPWPTKAEVEAQRDVKPDNE